MNASFGKENIFPQSTENIGVIGAEIANKMQNFTFQKFMTFYTTSCSGVSTVAD